MTDHQTLFDKLIYIDRLKRAGISDEQARAHANAMEDALRQGVATKSDITVVRQEIAALRTDMLAMEHRLTTRGGLMAAAVVAILASLKFFG